MKYLCLLVCLQPLLCHAQALSTEDSAILDESSALRFVASRMQERVEAKQARDDALWAETSVAEWEAFNGDVIYRQVSKPSPAAPRYLAPPSNTPLMSFNAPSAQDSQRFAFLNIQGRILSNGTSILEVADGDLRYEVVSNLSFGYLPTFGSILEEGIRIDFFAVVFKSDQALPETINSDVGGGRSRLKGLLQSPDASYFVSMKDGSFVSEEVYQTLDALHLYYAENSRRLFEERRRATLLSAATRRWNEENPKKVSEPAVINFWPIRSNTCLDPTIWPTCNERDSAV